MQKSDFVQSVRQKIVSILTKRGITKASLFGSAIHGTLTPDSDIDILVELAPHTSLFDYFEIKDDLEKSLHRSVDLVEYNSLHKRIKNKVLTEAVQLI